MPSVATGTITTQLPIQQDPPSVCVKNQIESITRAVQLLVASNFHVAVTQLKLELEPDMEASTWKARIVLKSLGDLQPTNEASPQDSSEFLRNVQPEELPEERWEAQDDTLILVLERLQTVLRKDFETRRERATRLADGADRALQALENDPSLVWTDQDPEEMPS